MKKLVLILALFSSLAASAQFPSRDSLQRYINRWVRNNAAEAFTNLRLNTALNGLLREIDSIGVVNSGIQQMYTVGDSLKIVTTADDTFAVKLPAGAGATNLSVTRNSTAVTVQSSSGTSGIIPTATQTLAGVLTAADKIKVDSAAQRSLLRDSVNNRVYSMHRRADSVFYVKSGAEIFAFKDSVGGVGTGTVTNVATGYGLSGGPITTTGTILVDSATLSNKYLRRADSTLYSTVTRLDTANTALRALIAPKLSNITGLVQPGTGVSISGSGTSGSPYIISSAVSGGTVTEVNSGYGLTGGPITGVGTLVVDTATLSSKYLRRADTSVIFSDYRTALNARVRYTDTSSMLSAYRTGLNARVRYTDTSSMLTPYQTALNARLQNITGYIQEGANIDITGSGTLGDPYIINGEAGGGGGSGTVNTGNQYQLGYYAANGTTISPLTLITGNRALVSNANGLPIASSVTSTELGYLSGVTSSIQTQLAGKQATGNYITALTGDVTATGPGSVAATIANDAVTFAKMQNVSTGILLGRYTSGTGDVQQITIGSGLSLNTSTGELTATGGGTGSVTSFSFNNANGFTGSVSNSTTTPQLTLSLDNNSVALGKLVTANARTVLGNATNSAGNVTEIQGSTDQVLRVASDGSALGFGGINLSSAAAVTGQLADAYISSAATWNAKLSNITGLITNGTNVTITGSGTSGDPYVINATPGGGGSGTVNSGAANRLAYYPSSGTTVDDLAAITANRALISDANGLPTHSSVTNTELGYLSGVTSAIQTQLDGKQPTGNYITALTGDGTASGPGSVAFTLATVNSNVGTFTFPSVTVNGKGLITAISSGTIDATPTDGSSNPVSSNGAFDALALKQATLVSGTNIKTINGNSVLGSGDLVISAGESPLTFQHSLSRTGNTINLVNDEASPGANHGYFTDESGVKGWRPTLPTVITSPEDDDILSYQGGSWVNIPMPATGGTTSITFKEVSFTATSGQTTFSHDSLSGKHVRVWREGVKQKVSDTYGYELSGTVITFYPALSLNEDVYVEVSPSSYWGTLTAGDYDSDAQAYFDAVATAGGTLTTEEKDAYNTFVLTGKSEGWYSNLVIFHPILTSTANAHPINSINPSVSGTNNGGITHNNGSVTFNGSSGYVNVGLNMSLTEADKNSLTFGAYVKNNVQADVYAFGMANTGASFNLAMVPRNTSDLAASIMYDPSNVITNASTNSIGLWEARRSSSTSFRMYKNNSQQGSTNTAANGLSMPSANVYYGATNVNGTATGFSTFEISCFFITNMGPDGTKLNQFNSALTTFLATLNKD